MKRKLSRLFTFILIVKLFTINVAAQEISDLENQYKNDVNYFSAEEKTDFKNQKDIEYNRHKKDNKFKKVNRNTIEDLMLRDVSSIYANHAKTYAELESYGCYVMNPSSDQMSILSSSGDVTLSKPTVYYNAYNKTWTVTCGGNWNNNKWHNDNNFFPGNVGGQDAFGVGYTSITGSYRSSVVSVSAYMNDGIIVKSSSTSNRSDGDGSKGFGFRIQDYVYTNSNLRDNYVGKNFGGLCNYDSAFSGFGAVATGYYFHTYSNATISSITFGVNGKTGGINATITNSANSWPAYSSDTRFGV